MKLISIFAIATLSQAISIRQLSTGVPPATFRDKNNCSHTYISPRPVEDFGLPFAVDCPKGKQEQSAYTGADSNSKAAKSKEKAEAAAEATQSAETAASTPKTPKK